MIFGLSMSVPEGSDLFRMPADVVAQDLKMAEEGNTLGVNDSNENHGSTQIQSGKAAVTENFNPSTFNSLHDHANKDCIQRASDLLVSISASAEIHKTKIINLAFAASEELMIMAQERDPLWLFDVDKGSEYLNAEEYKRRFTSLDPTLEEIIRVITEGEPSDLPNIDENVENMDSEASRAIGVVYRNPIDIVNMFMDVDKWSVIFSNIVAKARNLAVVSAKSQQNPDGALQVMVAEFQVPCPLVKTREMYFVRYSRQIDSCTWVVVDVSLEAIFPSPVVNCQRKPSGCIIQAFQDGLSAVTWVENNAVHNGVVHHMFKELHTLGFAFNAKRWVSSLERQYDRIATLEAKGDSCSHFSTNNQEIGVAKNGLLKLAERMVGHFHSNNCSNSAWRTLPVPGEQILIKTSLNLDDPHIPRGVAVTIATSVKLPVNQNKVFNFLRTEQNRQKWDILSQGQEIQNFICISSARNSTDCVSVVSVQGCSTTRKTITYLQESFNDSTAFYLVYAPVDFPTMHHILQGGSVDSVAILPSGFAILPDGSGSSSENTVLTISYQIMDEQLTTPEQLPPESLFTSYRLMAETVSRIRTALVPKIQEHGN